MAFHESGASGSGDAPISLPKWVLEVGKDNQDIFFTDRGGRRNTECISWGVDRERVLCGRTGVEVRSPAARLLPSSFFLPGDADYSMALTSWRHFSLCLPGFLSAGVF